jgi:site-specific recombinase XerD
MNLGLRVSELVTLKWRDVMHRSHVLPLLYLQRNLTKGKRPRGVPINSKAAKAILRLHRFQKKNGRSLGPDNYLFSGGTKGHLSSRHINRLLYALFDRAGLSGRLSSHTLRKTFGTILSDRGVNLPVIQELLGHADITTTRKYIGVGMGNMQKAVKLFANAY